MKLNIGKIKLKLPKAIMQYETNNPKHFNNLHYKKKGKQLYCVKIFNTSFRNKLCNKIINKYKLSATQKDILSTYIIDSFNDDYILSKTKLEKFSRYEIVFSEKDEDHWWLKESSDEAIVNRKTSMIKYKEKQTKLYKLSKIPYIPNKSGWVTANTNNVFEFDGVSYIINKDNKNYKCDAQNTSKMDRVFCAYTNDGIEFYDMNIDKIDAQLLQ